MSRRIKKKNKPHSHQTNDYDRLAVALEYYREKVKLVSPKALVIFNDILGDFAKRLGEPSMRRVKYDMYTDPVINSAVTFKFDRGEMVLATTVAENGLASQIDMADEYTPGSPYVSMVDYLRKQQFKNIEDARKYLGTQDSLLNTYLAYHRESGENFEVVSSFLEGLEELDQDEDEIYALPSQKISLRCIMMVGHYVIVFAFDEERIQAA